MTPPRTACLTRVRRAPGEDHASFYFTTNDLPTGRASRCRTTFFNADRVPPFDGDHGWFELERVKAVPWSYWRAVRQVEPPPGWKPPERTKLAPAQLLGHR